jgi:hypothetical protein
MGEGDCNITSRSLLHKAVWMLDENMTELPISLASPLWTTFQSVSARDVAKGNISFGMDLLTLLTVRVALCHKRMKGGWWWRTKRLMGASINPLSL